MPPRILNLCCLALCGIAAASLHGSHPEGPVGVAWFMASFLGIVATAACPLSRWRLMSACVAFGFAPIPLGLGYVARTLLVASAALHAVSWPMQKRAPAWLVAACGWPLFATGWVLAGGGDGARFAFNVITGSLVLAAGFYAAKRGFHYGRRPQAIAAGLCTLIAMSIWTYAYLPVSPIAVAVVYAPVFTLLAVPLYRGWRRRPLLVVALAVVSAIVITS